MNDCDVHRVIKRFVVNYEDGSKKRSAYEWAYSDSEYSLVQRVVVLSRLTETETDAVFKQQKTKFTKNRP